ncbi:MAG: TspO/MBR family protein [Candidatus Spechtbacterales bacterium]
MNSFLSFFVNQFGAASQIQYREWYGSLEKPFFAPPEWLFGTAWGLIYPLIGIAFVYSLVLFRKKKVPGSFIGIFVANIVANLAFTPLLLGTLNNVVGTISILAVLGTLALLQWHAWRMAKPVFWLLIPYLAWGSFATVLQLTITMLN